MRYLGSLKCVFRVKVSVGAISRPLGCLVRGRILAQARDWRVRSSSAGAVAGGLDISHMLEGCWNLRRPVASLM